MEINIKNVKQLLSHILLENKEIAIAVADTEDWKKDGKINAEVTFNSVTMNAELLEKALYDILKDVESRFKEKYDTENFDKRVEEKAKELLKEQSDNALEVISELTNKLQDVESLIKPYWER